MHYIDLSQNALNPLQGTEFSKAKALTVLILSGNPNIIQPNTAVVQVRTLTTLNLTKCNITQFYDNTFQHLSSLYTLYLDDNPIDEVSYFEGGECIENSFKN